MVLQGVIFDGGGEVAHSEDAAWLEILLLRLTRDLDPARTFTLEGFGVCQGFVQPPDNLVNGLEVLTAEPLSQTLVDLGQDQQLRCLFAFVIISESKIKAHGQ